MYDICTLTVHSFDWRMVEANSNYSKSRFVLATIPEVAERDYEHEAYDTCHIIPTDLYIIK